MELSSPSSNNQLYHFYTETHEINLQQPKFKCQPFKRKGIENYCTVQQKYQYSGFVHKKFNYINVPNKTF